MIFGGGETLIVHRRTVNPRTGDKGPDTPHNILDVAALPGNQSEDIFGEATTADFTCFCQPNDDILATDTVTLRGLLYSVVGQPQVIHDPFAGVDENKTFLLQRYAGGGT